MNIKEYLFIAIKGPNHDGHNYVNDALAKGAVGAVVGATYPEQLAELRQSMAHTWLLVPGL